MQARRTLLATMILGVVTGLAGGAVAQDFPTRPITVVVPAPVGGPLDVLARAMSERMRRSLGQPLVIENVGGAGGTVGVGRVARALPDGHTLSLGYLGTHVLNGAIYPLQYDLRSDFEPVAMLPSTPLLLAGRRALPANDLKELLAWLKGNSQKTNVATPGVGSPSHVMAVYLQKIVGAPLQFVHYRGGGPALQDLVAGHVDLFVNQPSILLPHFREGKIKVFALLGGQRLPQASHVPTSVEEGLADFQMSVWHGIWAPKGTPRDVVHKLNAAVRDAFNDAEVRTRLTGLGYDIPTPEHRTAHALATLQKAEIEKWWPIIKAANIKPE